ncbi:hypothetical protein FM042_10510 [Aliidiomarina halalkaliphila]|uniref:Lipoprotein n=1 Tax=Aliidiomarina halalkaliphila TaxID=2593535 RepID=A0A552WZ26_9GAMM|nr:hypothetical protein [Aliidiomarina halalkaliphila]TRW48081.1 hypothetical protein FM042_10510 [Aliidiomarina halalkaliphila]
MKQRGKFSQVLDYRMAMAVTMGLVLALALAACGPMYGPELRGEWKIKQIHTTASAELAPGRAVEWLGYSAYFEERRIRFSKYDCRNPSMTTDWQQWGLVAGRIGINPDLFGTRTDTPVQLLYIECDGEEWFTPGAELIRLDDERLLMAYQGVIFEFRQER